MLLSVWNILKKFRSRIYPRSCCFLSTGRISLYDPNLQNVTNDFEVTSGERGEKIFIENILSFEIVFSRIEKNPYVASVVQGYLAKALFY